ncbi:hypothetical protein GcM3_056045 [Golovinomyces cichoracearum]|uniref:Uncharacterized protein n=1 Tax=Golovinomyces cichoracearum TaxID=62708 RepID=A0A420IXY2_9PEZI|nr:hypothetical protein GcM3_056045 [Golovinomyces cichoracearum]
MSHEQTSESKLNEPTTIKGLVKQCRERDIEVSQQINKIQLEQNNLVNTTEIMEKKLCSIENTLQSILERLEILGPPKANLEKIMPFSFVSPNPKVHTAPHSQPSSPPLSKRPTYMPPFRPRPATSRTIPNFKPFPSLSQYSTANNFTRLLPSRNDLPSSNQDNTTDFKCSFYPKKNADFPTTSRLPDGRLNLDLRKQNSATPTTNQEEMVKLIWPEAKLASDVEHIGETSNKNKVMIKSELRLIIADRSVFLKLREIQTLFQTALIP